MPIAPVTIHREEILEVMADRAHLLRTKDNWLDKNYFTEDTNGQKYVRPGLVVARHTTTKKYVPYNASALYGAGSDTAVGILDTFEDATLDDPAIAPVMHGKAIEAHCYQWGGALGTVAAGVKTNLAQIEWV